MIGTAGTREIAEWISDVSSSQWLWYVKYLSANDTYAKRNVHQGGPHLGRALFSAAFPKLSLRSESEENPDLVIPARVDSHADAERQLRLVWYNSKRLGQANGRDEARLTKWGGASSPIVSAEATGSLVVFAFHSRQGNDADFLRIWCCRSSEEEDFVLDRAPDVGPGDGRLVSPDGSVDLAAITGSCSLTADQIPTAWLSEFPSGEDLLNWAIKWRPAYGDPDERLMQRRVCEEQVFYSLERHHAMPRISSGFNSVETFVEYAASLMNRRKSRSGRSLELQIRTVLREESVQFSWTPVTEQRKSPDFIFPSIEAYHNSAFPDAGLRMLAVKTTCKDRWRQILNEADRIPVKHLLTLQEGVSVPQFNEMSAHGVKLVVPQRLISSYPVEVQPSLTTVKQFIRETRSLR